MESILEQHPHIIFNLRISWGTRRGREYLSDLLLVEQGKTRQGFPFEAFVEIQFLLDIHDAVFPQFKPKSEDVWGETCAEHSNMYFGTIEYK